MQDKFKTSTLLQDRIVITKRGKKGKPQKLKTTEALHESWFFNMSPEYFVQMQKEWNDLNLRITLQPQENYDQWFNYFKTLPPNSIKLLAKTGMDILPTEAYAALSRWHDIIAHPGRIDKVHQSGLTNPKGKDEKSIVAMAIKNDRHGVLCATRDKLAEKLEKGAGNRDTALLVREMTEVMTQIADYERRVGPKKTTMLGKLIDDMPNNKRAKNRGARNTSFKSRVTIEDVENAR